MTSVVQGNALSIPLEDASVDLIITSPPYFALRSYRDADEHYQGQIGSEPTPKEFLDALIEATKEMIRVLKPSGSIWVNLGDKYAGSGGHNNNGLGASTLKHDGRKNPKPLGTYEAGVKKATRRDAPDRYNQDTGGVRSKSLQGLPWRYAIRCIDELGLILRAEVVWSKPNGLPESVTDRVRRSHEQWFHFTKEPRYFTAIDEIRLPTDTAGRTNGTSLGGSTLGPEAFAAISANDGATDGGGWCDLREAQVSVNPTMASITNSLQVRELIGLQVRLKVPERGDVVNLKVVGPGSTIGPPTDRADVAVALKGLGSLLPPVWAAIMAASATPSGAALTSTGPPPSSAALRRAEASLSEVAFGPGHGCAARITLASDEGDTTLLVWDAFATHGQSLPMRCDSLGKLPGSVWSIPSEPLLIPEWAKTKYNLPDHFAAFPQEWPRRIILGFSPSGICVECGEGRRPVVDRTPMPRDYAAHRFDKREGSVAHFRTDIDKKSNGQEFNRFKAENPDTITGYACACPEPTAETRPAVILDPFGGTGTVAMVARALGRTGISLDLSMDYCKLARWRIWESGHATKASSRTNLERQGSML